LYSFHIWSLGLRTHSSHWNWMFVLWKWELQMFARDLCYTHGKNAKINDPPSITTPNYYFSINKFEAEAQSRPLHTFVVCEKKTLYAECCELGFWIGYLQSFHKSIIPEEETSLVPCFCLFWNTPGAFCIFFTKITISYIHF